MTLTQLLTSLDQETQEAPTTLEEMWGTPTPLEETTQELSDPFDWLGIPALIKRLLDR